MRQQRHAADTVGDGVMHLHRKRRAFGSVGTVETFDECELPQRPGAVEAGSRDRLQHVEQRAISAGFGQSHAPQMKVDVECLLDRPARRPEAERRREHALTEPRDQARRPVDAIAQPGEIRNAVEDRNRDDRRSQDRILLHVPHERVFVAHMSGEARSVSHHTNVAAEYATR